MTRSAQLSRDYAASGNLSRAGIQRPTSVQLESMKLKLDLHEIFNHGQDIDRALRDIIDEAIAKKATLVEIIPGKGSGALKKHVLKFLDQKEIKAHVPPGGEGLQELRPAVRALQALITRAGSGPGRARLAQWTACTPPCRTSPTRTPNTYPAWC